MIYGVNAIMAPIPAKKGCDRNNSHASHKYSRKFSILFNLELVQIQVVSPGIVQYSVVLGDIVHKNQYLVVK
jgi:hypothetical protein